MISLCTHTYKMSPDLVGNVDHEDHGREPGGAQPGTRIWIGLCLNKDPTNLRYNEAEMVEIWALKNRRTKQHWTLNSSVSNCA